MILRYFVYTEITAPIVKLELEVPGDANEAHLPGKTVLRTCLENHVAAG